MWAQRGEAGGDRARSPVERRRQVLHQVDLVDVPPRDRVPHALDRRRVVQGAPARLPRTEPRMVCFAFVVIRDNIVCGADGTRCKWERARLRGKRRVVATDGRGQAVAEIEVGDEALRSCREEATVAQPRLDPLERPVGLVELEGVTAAHRRRPSAAMTAGALVGLGAMRGRAGTTLTRV